MVKHSSLPIAVMVVELQKGLPLLTDGDVLTVMAMVGQIQQIRG
jgi:hypothetical protein